MALDRGPPICPLDTVDGWALRVSASTVYLVHIQYIRPRRPIYISDLIQLDHFQFTITLSLHHPKRDSHSTLLSIQIKKRGFAMKADIKKAFDERPLIIQ